ncbi:DUF4238 domain-containing protein [Mucilaginibacter lappiensis]|uniref:DUF4238 domain-containing protein n=1 Tax=Mucilaginibacter lappiensis TaxID=354630 RepID=A0A841JQ78_9SPHI|nr:DUF4238 domain-containing protein [Mucilaginibacter lappiensis]MBB6130021.1 hypothetical protein [Mucilaginibacter lappiensis]
MPEKKKQHYVTRFLFKRFSSNPDQTQIHLYNLKTNTIIPNVAIKPQAQEAYYYGSDKVFENYLETTEVKAALIIEEIISGQCLFQAGNPKFIQLLHFIMLYEWRTKASVDQTQNYLNSMFREISKYDSRLKDIDFEKYRLIHKEPAAFNLSYYMDSWVVASDLIPFLLINETDQDFIMSDNPLIKYNPFMQKRACYWASNSILSKGIIYLFPLSTRYYIMLVDPETYEVFSTENDLIPIKNQSDINFINLLQCISADQNLYFAKIADENYVKKIAADAREYKIDKLVNQLLDNPEKPGIKTPFLYQLLHQLDFFFSFIRENKEAMEYNTENKLLHPRSQEILDYVLSLKNN